jgi:hypothetical protein
MPHTFDGLVLFGVALIGFLIAAIILQAVCALYNKLAGAAEPRHGFAPDDTDQADSMVADWPGGVPKLSLGQAMGIVCISAIANVVVGFLIGRLLGGGRAAVGRGLWATSPIAFLIALPAGILVMGATLPTSFGKGLLIALLYLLIWLVLGIVIITIVFAIILALGVLHNVG